MSHVRFRKPLWHLIDAKNQIVGRLATQVVSILRGKHKPTFSPNYDCGDYVVIINASEAKFSGQKTSDKLYRWHTGYPGGLKEKSVQAYLDTKPEEVCFKNIKSNVKVYLNLFIRYYVKQLWECLQKIL